LVLFAKGGVLSAGCGAAFLAECSPTAREIAITEITGRNTITHRIFMNEPLVRYGMDHIPHRRIPSSNGIARSWNKGRSTPLSESFPGSLTGWGQSVDFCCSENWRDAMHGLCAYQDWTGGSQVETNQGSSYFFFFAAPGEHHSGGLSMRKRTRAWFCIACTREQ